MYSVNTYVNNIRMSGIAIKPAECAGGERDIRARCVEAMLNIPNYVGDASV